MSRRRRRSCMKQCMNEGNTFQDCWLRCNPPVMMPSYPLNPYYPYNQYYPQNSYYPQNPYAPQTPFKYHASMQCPYGPPGTGACWCVYDQHGNWHIECLQ